VPPLYTYRSASRPVQRTIPGTPAKAALIHTQPA